MSSSFVPASRWLRHSAPLIALGAIVLAVVGLVALGWWIQIAAREMGTAATREFPGDRVEALMALVESDRHTLDQRNHAVWALGQLRDARALPVLQTYCTGQPCDHARYLCQSELKKAIRLLKSEGFDPMRWLTPAALRRRGVSSQSPIVSRGGACSARVESSRSTESDPRERRSPGPA